MAAKEEVKADSVIDSSWQLIKQGAEARVYSGTFLGRTAIIKERFAKSYRVAALDQKLTHRRMGQEARSIARCRKHGIRAPAIYHLDYAKRLIYMEFIEDGALMKDYIKQLDANEAEAKRCLQNIMTLIGRTISAMHNADIIHGDLTTSNMIYNATTGSLTMIDFGLSHISSLAEDKAVDLYVLERAFLSTHPNSEPLFQSLLDSYASSSSNAAPVIAKLDEVRMRGRKRVMVG